jgi:hypothetical protein
MSRLRPELLAVRPDVLAQTGNSKAGQRLRFFEALAQAFRAAAPLSSADRVGEWNCESRVRGDRGRAEPGSRGAGKCPSVGWVAFTLRFMLGDLKATRAASEQALARSADDPACRCEAHHAMGGTLSSLGELDASADHFKRRWPLTMKTIRTIRAGFQEIRYTTSPRSPFGTVR